MRDKDAWHLGTDPPTPSPSARVPSLFSRAAASERSTNRSEEHNRSYLYLVHLVDHYGRLISLDCSW